MLHRLLPLGLLVLATAGHAETRAVCKAACRDSPFVAECVRGKLGGYRGCRAFATKVCVHAGLDRCAADGPGAALAAMFGTWDLAYGEPARLLTVKMDFAYYAAPHLLGRNLSLHMRRRTVDVAYQGVTPDTYSYTLWSAGAIFCDRFDFDVIGEGRIVGIHNLVNADCNGDPIFLASSELMVGLRR